MAQFLASDTSGPSTNLAERRGSPAPSTGGARLAALPKAAKAELLKLLLAAAAGPEVIDQARAQAVEVLQVEALSPRDPDRKVIRSAVLLLKVLDAVTAKRASDDAAEVEIVKLEKLAATVDDRATRTLYREQAVALRRAHPRPADVAALRQVAARHREVAEKATSGDEMLGNWGAAKMADEAAALMERTLEQGVGAGSAATDELYKSLRRQADELHRRIDDDVRKVGGADEVPARPALKRPPRSAVAIQKWVDLNADFRSFNVRIDVLEKLPVPGGPTRVNTRGSRTSASDDGNSAELRKVAEYRQLASASYDRGQGAEFRRLADELESKINNRKDYR